MKGAWILLLMVAVVLFPQHGKADGQSLQSLIDATPEGETIILEDKLYSEPISVDRPITIRGKENTGFQVCADSPAITITGEGVHLENVKIVRCLGESGSAAMAVSGKNHQLSHIFIEADQIGILAEEVENSLFEHIRITGTGKRNGMEIWYSDHNRFQHNRIENVADGFYLENSPNNLFLENTVQGSRYGLHVMYSDKIVARNNRFVHNVTGAMIMETEHTVVENNQLGGNAENVNAQGLLLYDVYRSMIKGNHIFENRVGMFIENSYENTIEENEVHANFIGAQLNRTENQLFTKNSFTLNVNDIQGIHSSSNRIIHNYWDQADQLDSDGDKKSDLPHSADPYFLELTEEVPEYQLFFHHPGMIVLQNMLKSPKQLLITDSEPLMENPFAKDEHTDSNGPVAWFVSLTMIAISLLFILFGRRKSCGQ